MSLSRRRFVQLAGSGMLVQSAASALGLFASEAPVPGVFQNRSKVALIHGDDRRMNIRLALETVDADVQAGLKRKKYVVIKPNNVTAHRQLGATHVDALNGILDYLTRIFHGGVGKK